MTQLVINLSRVTQQVGIIDDQGRKTSFRLMARGRVETNYQIDPAWLAHNPGAVKVIAIDPPVETAQPDTPPTSTEAGTKPAAKKIASSIETDSTKAEGAKE